MANTARKISESPVEESAPMQVVKNQQTATEPAVVEIPVEQPAPQPELSLEQRIAMVEDLTMLIDRWRKLQESYRNLQKWWLKVLRKGIKSGLYQPDLLL